MWREKKYKEDPEYFNRYQRNWRDANPEKYLLRKAANHAKDVGREFNLIEEDIKIPDVCPVFKTPFEFSSQSEDRQNSPSIDRFDNSKGYIKDNINIISWRANKLKADGTLKEFEDLVNWMKEKNG